MAFNLSKRSKTMLQEQKNLLVQFVESNPNLMSGKFSSTFNFASAQALWEGAADRLNAVPYGSKRNWKHWRKTWHDFRQKSKVRRAALRRSRNETQEIATESEDFNAEEAEELPHVKFRIVNETNENESDLHYLDSSNNDPLDDREERVTTEKLPTITPEPPIIVSTTRKRLHSAHLFFNTGHSYHIKCPNNVYPANISVGALRTLCPSGVQLCNVQGVSARDKSYPCRWKLLFQYVNASEDGSAYIDAKKRFNLRKNVDKNKPGNTNILNESLIIQDGLQYWEFEYGVICDCNVQPVFSDPTT